MGKMYYSTEEAAQRLGVTEEELAGLVEQGQLMVYADGADRVYRADEVDGLAGPAEAGAPIAFDTSSGLEALTPADTADELAAMTDTGEVELTPAGESDIIDLADTADEPIVLGKDDTVISSEGISVFDDEDLEVETADPMAKTTIAPSVEDQISLEGIGSGSGLLDLTRESDDTSLGAEVLDHIDSLPTSSGVAEAIASADIAYGEEPEPVVAVEAPTVVEEVDPSSGAFAGLIVAGMIIMLVATAAVVPAIWWGVVPSYVETLTKNMIVFVGASVVLGVVAAIIGYFVGKSMAVRIQALQRSGV